MSPDLLVENGEWLAYALSGVLALLGLGIVQLVRRRRDLKRARTAVRLVTYSISDPRPGPIAVQGTYRSDGLDCSGQRVTFDSAVEIVCGTSGRWRNGTRSYAVRDGDSVIAIGVMSKGAIGWGMVASPGEAGIQLYAAKPRPAPAPLFPWRALIWIIVCGGIAFGGLYELGTVLVDAPRDCDEATVLRLQISAALPLVRDEALTRLGRCH